MAYIGRQTTQGDFVKLDSIKSQFNGVTKTFDLKSGVKSFSQDLRVLFSVTGWYHTRIWNIIYN